MGRLGSLGHVLDGVDLGGLLALELVLNGGRPGDVDLLGNGGVVNHGGRIGGGSGGFCLLVFGGATAKAEFVENAAHVVIVVE